MEELDLPRIAGLPDDAFAADSADLTRFAVRALLDGFQQLLDQRGSSS